MTFPKDAKDTRYYNTKLNNILYVFVFQICSVSIHLQHSAINLDCSEEVLTNVKDLDPEKKRLVLDRICQFKDETSGETKICDSHYSALITNFRRHAKCLSETHPEDRRLSGKIYAAAVKIGPDLSNHVHINTGYIMPVGGFLCKKCENELYDSLPPMAKKKVVVPESPQSQAGSNSSSEPSQNDEAFQIPSQDAQKDRVEGLNKLLEFNNMKPRFSFRMGGEDKTKTFAGYQQQHFQMELLLASFQAVLNTVSNNKADHDNIWGTVVESHKMDERLGYIDKLILDMIQVYNKCSSDRQRRQVRTF